MAITFAPFRAPLLDNMLIILSAFIIFNIFSHPASSHTSCLNQTCGNVIVSFPFSLANRNDCTPFSSFFELECNPSGKLYLAPNASFNASLNDVPIPLRVQEIKNDSLIVDISDLTALFVDINATYSVYNTSSIELAAYPGPYFISDDNKFGSFGCSVGMIVTAKLKSSLLQDFSEVDQCGCFVFCPADKNNPDCGKNLCCVVNVPQGSSPRYAYYYAEASYYANATSCDSNCSNYRGSANLFHPNYTSFSTQSYGLKLKWALPSTQTNETSALIQSPEYACSENANLTVVAGVPGYLCSCNPGYTGDGYSKGHGCKDVDECQDSSMNNCIRGVSTCQNSNGSYTCKCNSRFYVEDERIDGSQCRFSPSIRNAFAITGAIFGLAFLMGCLIFLAIWRRQRTKRKYFIQNGGLQVQKYVAPRGRETPKLFKSEELKAATNSYSDKTKLGVGGFGTVFKGTLADGRVVAIKKANRGTDGDSEQFLNEMAILTQINHRHIVRLLGFCLESQVPLLVYEYVSNGNVAQNLQQQESEGDDVLGWEQRLKVARQTADALGYLHAAASPPILHRDVKSANVLLDDNLDAKLADFGVSRLVPDGVDHVSTAVQGTIGYLDPEYFQTLQLTDKSDVYSFGVMLVELITGLKPVDNYGREPRFTNLALLFIERMQEGRGDELIDPRLENPSALPGSDAIWRTHSSIMAVATLARRCLALIGAERPSMSHVVDELRYISKSLEGVDDDDNEALPLLASEEKYLDYHKAGAVVAQNSKYHVHSSSRSMFIDNSLLDFPTMPR